MIKRWIINIIDKSESMSFLKNTVIKEYNVFLRDIKSDPHDIRWTTILFNNSIDFIHDDSVKNINELQDGDYKPEKGTALLDALGKACIKIVDNSVHYNDIVMNIFTDGNENCSFSYTYSSVNDLLNSVKNKYSFVTNFYCTTEESLNITNKLPSIDTTYVNSFNGCMRQMSSNSINYQTHTFLQDSFPQIKKQKRT